jgi:hypothetical protein
MWEDIFTVLSNLAFIIPITKAWKRDKLGTVLVYTFQMFASAAYHSCNSFPGYCLGLRPTLLRDLDFFWAQYLIFLTPLNLIIFPTYKKAWRWTPPLLMVAAGTLIFFLQRWIGESTILQFSIAAVSLGGLILYWIVYAIYHWLERDRDGSLLPPYRWPYLTYGLALSGMASSLYVTEMQNHNLYWAIHSVWHLSAALGQYFLLQAREKAVVTDPKRAILLQRITEKERWTLPRPIVHRTPPSRV